MRLNYLYSKITLYDIVGRTGKNLI